MHFADRVCVSIFSLSVIMFKSAFRLEGEKILDLWIWYIYTIDLKLNNEADTKNIVNWCLYVAPGKTERNKKTILKHKKRRRRKPFTEKQKLSPEMQKTTWTEELFPLQQNDIRLNELSSSSKTTTTTIILIKNERMKRMPNILDESYNMVMVLEMEPDW